MGWVPQKVGMSYKGPLFGLILTCSTDVPIQINDQSLSLDIFKSAGKLEGETELAESAEGASRPCLRFPCAEYVGHDRTESKPALPDFNAAAMAQLEGMGFPIVRCQKALLATGNSDPEAAMNWLLSHMEDSGEYRLSRA